MLPEPSNDSLLGASPVRTASPSPETRELCLAYLRASLLVERLVFAALVRAHLFVFFPASAGASSKNSLRGDIPLGVPPKEDSEPAVARGSLGTSPSGEGDSGVRTWLGHSAIPPGSCPFHRRPGRRRSVLALASAAAAGDAICTTGSGSGSSPHAYIVYHGYCL